MPASRVARQGQQPAVLALLPACSESQRQSDSFIAGSDNSPLLASSGENAGTLGSSSGSSAVLPLRWSRAGVPSEPLAVAGAALTPAHGATGKGFSSLGSG